jgi:hypothetical protein
MKTRFCSDDDEWTTAGAIITTPERLAALRQALDKGPVIVEHWFYRGACSPERIVFDDFDELLNYLSTKAYAGDAIHVWSFAVVCKDSNQLAHGKCPDDQGRVPKPGGLLTIAVALAAGRSREDILRAYPYLEPADIDEALAYAAWRVAEHEVPLPVA